MTLWHPEFHLFELLRRPLIGGGASASVIFACIFLYIYNTYLTTHAHRYTYIRCIYIYQDTHAQVYIHTCYTHVFLYIYIYLYQSMISIHLSLLSQYPKTTSNIYVNLRVPCSCGWHTPNEDIPAMDSARAFFPGKIKCNVLGPDSGFNMKFELPSPIDDSVDVTWWCWCQSNDVESIWMSWFQWYTDSLQIEHEANTKASKPPAEPFLNRHGLPLAKPIVQNAVAISGVLKHLLMPHPPVLALTSSRGEDAAEFRFLHLPIGQFSGALDMLTLIRYIMIYIGPS